MVGAPSTLGLCKWRETVEDDHKGEESEGDPSGVGLEGRLEYQRVAIDALRLQSLVETNVAQADTAPGEALSDGDEVLEPQKDLVCTGSQAHERQKGEDGGYTDTVDRDTFLGALQEELRSLAILCDTKEVT